MKNGTQQFVSTRDVEAEAGCRSGGSGSTLKKEAGSNFGSI